MKILVVEDEPVAADFLQRGLSEEGYAVDVAQTGYEADEAVALRGYDAILLDVMLPGADGFSLCAKWRGEGLRTPILFLTARDDTTDRVRGLDLGGDDYLIKPFSFEELLARVRALLRRGNDLIPPMQRFGTLTVDTGCRRVEKEGREIVLTTREYQLLEYLAFQFPRVVSRTRLWEHVWESGSEPDSNVVDVYVGYLRGKLGRDSIETVRGQGYRLAEANR